MLFSVNPDVRHKTYEKGLYQYFNPSTWRRETKIMTLFYSELSLGNKQYPWINMRKHFSLPQFSKKNSLYYDHPSQCWFKWLNFVQPELKCFCDQQENHSNLFWFFFLLRLWKKKNWYFQHRKWNKWFEESSLYNGLVFYFARQFFGRERRSGRIVL